MPDDYEIPYTIIFPRGYAAENYWCTICNYKYAELIEQGK